MTEYGARHKRTRSLKPSLDRSSGLGSLLRGPVGVHKPDQIFDCLFAGLLTILVRFGPEREQRGRVGKLHPRAMPAKVMVCEGGRRGKDSVRGSDRVHHKSVLVNVLASCNSEDSSARRPSSMSQNRDRTRLAQAGLKRKYCAKDRNHTETFPELQDGSTPLRQIRNSVAV